MKLLTPPSYAGENSVSGNDEDIKKTLYGKGREDVREIIKTLCKYKGVEIIEGAVCIGHVHLSIAISSKLSITSFKGYLKGKKHTSDL